jgi:hypothetical protein
LLGTFRPPLSPWFAISRKSMQSIHTIHAHTACLKSTLCENKSLLASGAQPVHCCY